MFRLNGKEMKLSLTPSNSDAVEKFLDKMKFGDLVTSTQLSNMLNIGTFNGTARHDLAKKLKDNCLLYKNQWVWGSKKTISEFKKQINNISPENL